MDNNVYVLRCTETGDAVLLDAANEHDRLLDLARSSACAPCWRPTATGTTSRRSPRCATPATTSTSPPRTPACCRPTTRSSTTTAVIEVGRLRLRTIHTPGHTPGSMCFLVEGAPVLFSGDTLFPGGPGTTTFPGGDFPRSSARSRTGCSRCRRDPGAARPRRPHHHRHRAPPPPGVDRPGLVRRPDALRYDERPYDETPVHTERPAGDAGPRPQHPGLRLGRGARPSCWRLGDDLPGRPVADYKRRIGPWLLWRAGPASGADARYWVARADDLAVSYTFRLFPVGRRRRRGPQRHPPHPLPVLEGGPASLRRADPLEAIGAVDGGDRPRRGDGRPLGQADRATGVPELDGRRACRRR